MTKKLTPKFIKLFNLLKDDGADNFIEEQEDKILIIGHFKKDHIENILQIIKETK